MPDRKKAEEYNDKQFFKDLKSVYDVMVYAPSTGTFLELRRKNY